MDLMTWVRNQWDRVAAWALVALGAIAVMLGWIGVTGTPYTFEQIPYVISGGIGGIFLLGVGAMLWISADLRDEWRKLDRLLELHEDRAPGARSDETPAEASTADVLARPAPTSNGSAIPAPLATEESPRVDRPRRRAQLAGRTG